MRRRDDREVAKVSFKENSDIIFSEDLFIKEHSDANRPHSLRLLPSVSGRRLADQCVVCIALELPNVTNQSFLNLSSLFSQTLRKKCRKYPRGEAAESPVKRVVGLAWLSAAAAAAGTTKPKWTCLWRFKMQQSPLAATWRPVAVPELAFASLSQPKP